MDKYIKTPLGERIKYWREQKGISQLDLALECDSSAKHLSFIETGKATPNRELLVSLLEVLAVPLEVTNNLLISAGFAPSYQGTGLTSEQYSHALTAMDSLLDRHKDLPALIIDKHWQLVKANEAFSRLCQCFCPNPLLYSCPSPNLLTLLLHPQGLIAAVEQPQEFYLGLYSRARRLAAVMPSSARLNSLMDELISYAPSSVKTLTVEPPQLMQALTLKNARYQLTLALTCVCLGDPLNVSLQERQLEIFMPLSDNDKQALASLLCS
jgi:transcriptional regulator with XRE-family HTH domain